MTPWDWKALVKLVLPTAQYSLWSQEQRDYCPTLALKNLQNSIPVDKDMPVGEGQYMTVVAQTHLHRVGDVIQPSHPLSSLSPALNLSKHQGLF